MLDMYAYSNKISQSIDSGIDRMMDMLNEFDKRYYLNDLTNDDYELFINELRSALYDIQDMHIYELSADSKEVMRLSESC